MFYLSREVELTDKLLQKIMNSFLMNTRPIRRKYKDYYDGKQKILQKTYSDASKPCNKVITNYCADIVSSYSGYIASPGYISYTGPNDISEVMDCLRYNDYQDEDSDFLTMALIYGTAAELMYTDTEGKVRFRLINPLQCFGIYDDSLSSDLLYFVRWYRVNEWDESDTYRLDLYSDATIRHYQMNGENGFLTFLGEEPHYFNQCPANIFSLDEDERSIFDCVLSLQDAYNEILSGEIDDYDAFCDAYLAITGCDADSEDMDCAFSEIYDAKRGTYHYCGREVDLDEIIGILKQATEKYNFLYIEDPVDENDWEGWVKAAKALNRTTLCGDDLTVTNIDYLRKALDMGACGAFVFKPNQVGTVTEAMEAQRYAVDHGMFSIPSIRAGGVSDDPVADMGIAGGAAAVKLGPPKFGHAIHIINSLLRAETELPEAKPFDFSPFVKF